MKAEPATVLIAEDESLLLDIVSTEVEEEGFRVLRAMTAEAALSILESPGTVDILFTDIKLPGAMNGWRLAREATRLRTDLQVLLATGYTEEKPENVERSRFFTEPYSVESVIGAMRAIAASHRPL